ncbi:MAG TPA: sigma-70 family RNA polymerase sigma factor [Bacteroidales bacterium]|nr:sigma-70 family RNA polymerase sigma factor [Bacteroidales bacterium]HRT90068.1 sigma-70 family RNA polymerase sigma factor [Bacteroidales bacterium]
MGRRGNHDTDIPDKDLVGMCAEGDIRAQEILYRRYFSFAMSVCIRYAKNDHEAMEAVNDSYMKVLDNIKTFDASKPFRPWYGKILVNTSIDRYRKSAVKYADISCEQIAETEDHEPEVEADLSAAEIIALFNRLPEQYKITFNLYEIEGYSHDEISKMLNISVSTSRSNLARAKKMLKELYVRNHSSARSVNEAI